MLRVTHLADPWVRPVEIQDRTKLDAYSSQLVLGIHGSVRVDNWQMIACQDPYVGFETGVNEANYDMHDVMFILSF